jgi:hypothetical protein
MALTRQGSELLVFDRVGLSHPGHYRWPLLGPARDLKVRGAELLRRQGIWVEVAARQSFTLTYRVGPVGQTTVVVKPCPYPLATLVVFVGRGVAGSGQSEPKPRSIARVVVGGVHLTAFSFGPLAAGSVLRWSLLTGDLASTLGEVAVGVALACIAGALFFLRRLWAAREPW